MTKRIVILAATVAFAALHLIVFAWVAPPVWTASAVFFGVSVGLQAWLLAKGKRNGLRRKTKADTSDSKADRKAVEYTYYASNRTVTTYSSPGAPWLAESVWRGCVDGIEYLESDMPILASDMPILAHRAARLAFGSSSNRPFLALNSDICYFGIDADAMCRAGGSYPWGTTLNHKAPHVDCSCGFYALPTDLPPTYNSPSYVNLMVELSGTVIECERGYRAEHQRVVECQVGPCEYCGAEPDLVIVKDHVMVASTCAAHKPVDEPGFVYVSVDDLAAVLPVPVTRVGHKKAEL